MSEMKTLRYVRLSGLADGARIRTARFEDVEHVVVPVVMLVGNNVIEPLGSSGPEFVPADILELGHGSWNGRPVVPDHPSDGEGAISANMPTVLESQSFGRLFHVSFENNSLKAEAWLDPVRAAKVGSDAVRVVERCQAGELVEVSVGAWTVLEAVSGRYDGVSYDYRWSTCVVPDHLAMLPEGAVGACSAEMGCGAPRINRGAKFMADAKTNVAGLNSFQRVLRSVAEMIGIQTAAGDTSGVSDGQLRSELWEALRAVVPGFDYVIEVYPDTSTVVYCARPKDEYIYFSRTYTRSESGSAVDLGSDETQVESRLIWEPVAGGVETKESATALKAACACTDKSESPDTTDLPGSDASNTAVVPATVEGENMPADVTALVGRLIADTRSPYAEAHRVELSAMPLARLEAIATVLLPDGGDDDEEARRRKAAEDEAAATAAAAQPAPAVVTEAQLPQALQQMLARARAIETAQRKSLMGQMGTAATSAGYTQAQLDAMPIEDLARLAKLAGASVPAVDYSLQGVPVDVETPVVPPAPDIYGVSALQESYQAARNGSVAGRVAGRR